MTHRDSKGRFASSQFEKPKFRAMQFGMRIGIAIYIVLGLAMCYLVIMSLRHHCTRYVAPETTWRDHGE